jgi:regulator of protease activity HflC (stomatin/prohibitin superfamily)
MNSKIVASILGFVIALFALITFFGTWGTIDAGHRGVVVRMGAVTGEVKGEGAYFKAPWITDVIEMDVRTKKEQVQTSGASKDLQVVNVVVALNLSLDPSKAAHVYQNIGEDYLNIVVAPAMQEATKAGVAEYTAEELISKREIVREKIARLVASKLSPLGIRTEALNIVNFNFSRSFNEAIEAKVTAEQNALASKNKLEQTKYEAEQAIVTARGDAEALRVKAQAIAQSPQVLQLNAIAKWDGHLPQYMGSGPVPFLNLK